ncbi:M14 family metallopeptidase [Flaviaesturariibacter terrae]
MRKPVIPFLLAATLSAGAQERFPTYFEQHGGNGSPSYFEAIAWWKKLDAASPLVLMKTMGPTDAGEPLHLVLVSADGDFDPASIHRKGKTILFVNNGIHPGEPDGIDASMLLVRAIVERRFQLPANVVLAIIPVYNIGGALNRSPYYRIDQDGPEEKGSRGNAQYLDLNRDFIKADSRNARSFARIFHWLDPEVFVDNHVSNGADYQHVMTLLSTQHNKLGGAMGAYLNKTFEPALYSLMKARSIDLVPYVNHWNDGPPEKGWPEFHDSPRYSSGYTTLWNTFGFVPETHMLKPYAKRVEATRLLMESFIAFMAAHAGELRQARAQQFTAQAKAASLPLAWRLDPAQHTDITFNGFEAAEKRSDVSGLPRRYYDRSRPFTKQIPFYNTYIDSLPVTVPQAYIIPQGWWKVIERLQANGIRMRRLAADTVLDVEGYRIESYTAAQRPYEGHHPNSNVQVSRQQLRQHFRKGDYYVPLQQPGERFLMETLEPQAEDSYFAWNFFDAILAQKEGFSDYVFEDRAAAFLKEHPVVQAALEERRKTDSAFAKSAAAQLDFVYKRSPWYEPGHMQYPVFRLLRAAH